MSENYTGNVERLVAENTERLKELAAINQTTNIIKEGKSIDETLQQICLILPKAWQYPEHTVARITYEGKEYLSHNFVETKWQQRQTLSTIDGQKGSVEIFYTKEFDPLDEGPFLKEERHLINNLASMISGFINSFKAKQILKKEDKGIDGENLLPGESEKSATQRKLLQSFLNKQNYDRDIYHDLMPFKVKEILIVATLYDAFSIEKEGRFTEHILGEYYQLNLTSMPRVTGVSSVEEALEQLNSKHFDLVILMMGVDKNTPLLLSKKVKQSFPYIPVYLLLNNDKDAAVFENIHPNAGYIDKIFAWNGDSRIFFAMVKYLEDRVNLDNDTEMGLVGVILLVEDSVRFYSRYLPMLYTIVLEQTKNLIEEVNTDELYKVLRLRARPKIILASNYEEAQEVFNKYKEFMLCLITDMKFMLGGEMNKYAGVELIKYIRNHVRDMPTIIQSSDPKNADVAHEQKVSFINKNSETLLHDFRSFINYYLGFGNFVYKDANGRDIAVAKTLKEFEALLKTIPEESLTYHAKRNHFSLWLMARGEIQIAKIIKPAQIKDFKSPKEMRRYLTDMIQKYRNEQNKGKVVSFEESSLQDESNIVSLATGSLGGKGRGISFIHTLIYNFDFSLLLPDINIKTPKTAIIGTDEFDLFFVRNHLQVSDFDELSYQEIKTIFLQSSFTEGLVKKLRKMLRLYTKPLAVRSSGLFEDSLMQPFAGIFETYILPNSHPELDVRLNQLLDAIKLVYASVFSPMAKDYIEAINYKIEEEKMAVIIQEVVGNMYEQYFYPHISGTAQSYNYYPFAHMKPEEGFAIAAVGLGMYVVDGEKAHRFSPKYPNTEISSPTEQYKNSQVHFYAVDLKKRNVDLSIGETAGLATLEISEAEKHGTLKHSASVFDADYQRIIPGITQPGPRIVNFANILKYNYIPLAKTIETILDIVKESFGSPVEIEFAVDLNKDQQYKASFYLLQIKPLLTEQTNLSVDYDNYKKDDMILYAEKGMGNGIIDDITDLIYIKPERFDKTKTTEMADEIEKLNADMVQEKRKYILIGPGRWGTSDRFIGIPVKWPQISNAKIIVEMSLEGFPLDASLGSHFFHNVVSMGVAYISVNEENKNSFIRWDKIERSKIIRETKFFNHVHFEKPLKAIIDGKKRRAFIMA